MKSIAHSNIATLRRSALPSKLGAMLALGLAGAVLAGSIVPAAARNQGGQGRVTQASEIRDHRTLHPEPMVRDHTGGAKVRDSRGSLDGKGKHRIPCFGNLC